jgi:hypothetical protein
MTTNETRRGVHLLGSVPIGDAEEVFRGVSAAVGPHLQRLPDGEQVTKWIGSQIDVFSDSPFLQAFEPEEGHYGTQAVRRMFQVRDGVDPSDISFPELGYAHVAKESFETFKRLKAEGAVPEHVRFQVSLPTPLAPVVAFCEPSTGEVFPAYEQAMLREVDAIAAAIPHDQLAIQWDVAIEMGILEDFFPVWFGNDEDTIVALLARAAARVPADVALGFHLCYGDADHRHWKEPVDTSKLASLATKLAQAVDRPISWLHLPVPRGRTDSAYFAPLAEMRLRPETQLYLGLVHRTDGLDGARARIEAATSVVQDFGVATECGLGRRPPETIPGLLQLHAQVAEGAAEPVGAGS